MRPLTEAKRGRVSTCTVSYIFKRNVSVGFSLQRPGKLKKMPSITIHRYTVTPHLHLKSAWLLYARMHRTVRRVQEKRYKTEMPPLDASDCHLLELPGSSHAKWKMHYHTVGSYIWWIIHWYAASSRLAICLNARAFIYGDSEWMWAHTECQSQTLFNRFHTER